MISEFSLIDRFFKRQPVNKAITEAVGDDCALLNIPPGKELAITTDTMVESVHFFSDCDPYDLGHKLLAVNLSDLAAMGATPLAVTLALTLPNIDESWLTAFANGFFKLAESYNVDLIGGDTTSGPLTLTVTALGLLPLGKALKRSAANPGDYICVTGNLGDAGLGFKVKSGYLSPHPEVALQRFNRPEPRVAFGQRLLGIASACIDISDGLTGDLGHILIASGAGACLDWEDIPLSDPVLAYILDTGDWLMPLTAGDDYELCFTISPERISELADMPYTKIGNIEAQPGIRLNKDGFIKPLHVKCFEHFFEEL